MTTITVRELADKPDRWIVVEESGDYIITNHSGIQGCTKDEAEEIARRIRTERQTKKKGRRKSR